MKLRKIFLGAGVFLLAGWLGDLIAGTRIAHLLAGRCGGIILRFTKGKIAPSEVQGFIQHRMAECLWLMTLALVLITAHWLFESWRRKQNRFPRTGWAIHGVAAFVFLNLWIGAAANTALYWGIMGAGSGVQNLMQFELKRILMAESPNPHRAVLVGNSQTRAQIDENELNTLIGDRLWTTELHWPGSQAFDLLLVERQIRQANPEFVLCYVTTGYLYANSTFGETVPPFFSLSDIPDFTRRGAFHEVPANKLYYGFLGDVMPLFRSRDVLAQRFLGDATVNLKQVEYNNALEVSLAERAKVAAAGYQTNCPSTPFQKQAFEDFIVRCQKANRRVILFAGQNNPLLENQLSPALRADMFAFLKQMEAHHANVILVTADEMPVEPPEGYDDLSHVNLETQKRFSDWLADWLDKKHLLEAPQTAAKK
jgi:hypothetical protein